MNSADANLKISAARQAIGRGDIENAGKLAAELLSQSPDDLDALEIKALVASARGDNETAIETLRTAIAIATDRRWPYGDLARLLVKLNRKTEAEEVARAALRADAQNADAHAMLASLLTERGLASEATTHFQRAIALAGAHPQLLAGVGHALLRQGRLDDARAPLEAAASSDPRALEPVVHLAELEEKLGNFESAMTHLDHAQRIATARGTDVDLQRSVLLERMAAYDEALALLDGRDDLSGAALLQRGRLRERVGRHAEAWTDWTTGKAMLSEKAGRHYAAADVAREAEALTAFFSADRSAALTRASRHSGLPQPIFIIGFPRSGTTLTEQILASHSGIRAGGELPFGGDLRDLAAALAGGEANFPAGLADHLDWPVQLRDLYLARAGQYGLLAEGAAWFTDKMPSNDFWLPLLRLASPESPVIFVRRHPLDVLTSVMAHDMTHGFDCAYRLEDAARHLALVDRLLETYRAAGLGPTHELRYESLVADQAGETERLMQAIGLPMESAQLSFHEREMVSPTPSYAQVRQPLNDRSIGRSRNFARELERVRPIVAEAMERGGYAG